MSVPFTWTRRTRWVKLRLPLGLGGPRVSDRWAVCTGAIVGPARGCRWQVLCYCADREAAEASRDAIPNKHGRAIVDLNNPDLRLVDETGAVWLATQTWRELLS